MTILPTPLHAPFRLPDGRGLQFGAIGPASRGLIQRAMRRLSPETSRRRFFTVRYQLSERELDELTLLDGIQRFAVGASVTNSAGEAEGVGVARYVRDPRDARTAELALLVVDAYQGSGIGRTLLARLATAAVERGIAFFRGLVLVDNRPMLRLLREYAPDMALHRIDDYYRVDVPLVPQRYKARSHEREGPLPSASYPEARSAEGGPFNSITLPSGSWM